MYIVGLGNPGKEYEKTRHNVGWMVLDTLRTEWSCGDSVLKKHWQAVVCNCKNEKGMPLTLVYPQTFMNRSGETVRAIVHDDTNASVIIIHDDTALPLGTIKISQGRGDGGHNGIKSINHHVKQNDFVRIRIGVAAKRWWGSGHHTPTGRALPKHVLSDFSWWERGAITDGIATAAAAVKVVSTQGVTVAMNIFNQTHKK